MQKREVSLRDRIVAAISYITMGYGGFFYLIYMAFKRAPLSRFIRYNILQSIFVSLLFFIIAFTIGFIMNILSYIPYLNILIAKIVLFFNSEKILHYSITQVVVIVIMLYMAFVSFNGKYPRIYFVSKIIDRQIK